MSSTNLMLEVEFDYEEWFISQELDPSNIQITIGISLAFANFSKQYYYFSESAKVYVYVDEFYPIDLNSTLIIDKSYL